MAADRVRRQEQLVGDLPVCLARRDQPDDRQLGVGQARPALGRPGRLQVAPYAQPRRDQGGSERAEVNGEHFGSEDRQGGGHVLEQFQRSPTAPH